MNYFEFYDIPVSFQVDESELRRIYYRNSKQYHPDFHTLADEGRQAEMLELSTLNNKAWKTLSDPDARMRYILEIKGLLNESDTPALPQTFLMDMMDINENLMELEFDFDATRYAQTLNAVDALEKELNDDIRPLLDASGSLQNLQQVRDFYLKKRYLLRIRENLSKFAPALNQGAS